MFIEKWMQKYLESESECLNKFKYTNYYKVDKFKPSLSISVQLKHHYQNQREKIIGEITFNVRYITVNVKIHNITLYYMTLYYILYANQKRILHGKIE